MTWSQLLVPRGPKHDLELTSSTKGTSFILPIHWKQIMLYLFYYTLYKFNSPIFSIAKWTTVCMCQQCALSLQRPRLARAYYTTYTNSQEIDDFDHFIVPHCDVQRHAPATSKSITACGGRFTSTLLMRFSQGYHCGPYLCQVHFPVFFFFLFCFFLVFF